MSFDNHKIVQEHFGKNPKLCNHYLNNKEKIEEQWEKIKKHKDIERFMKSNEFKLEKKEALQDYIRLIILEDGDKTLKRWKLIKYFSFFGAILFLVVLYLMFWYISSDFKMIQESFSNLFCVS